MAKSRRKESGNWSELFGLGSSRVDDRWSIAEYINAVAKAGKAVTISDVHQRLDGFARVVAGSR